MTIIVRILVITLRRVFNIVDVMTHLSSITCPSILSSITVSPIHLYTNNLSVQLQSAQIINSILRRFMRIKTTVQTAKRNYITKQNPHCVKSKRFNPITTRWTTPQRRNKSWMRSSGVVNARLPTYTVVESFSASS